MTNKEDRGNLGTLRDDVRAFLNRGDLSDALFVRFFHLADGHLYRDISDRANQLKTITTTVSETNVADGNFTNLIDFSDGSLFKWYSDISLVGIAGSNPTKLQRCTQRELEQREDYTTIGTPAAYAISAGGGVLFAPQPATGTRFSITLQTAHSMTALDSLPDSHTNYIFFLNYQLYFYLVTAIACLYLQDLEGHQYYFTMYKQALAELKADEKQGAVSGGPMTRKPVKKTRGLV